MDKFGVLNLLNSLLGFASGKNDGASPSEGAFRPAETPSPAKTAFSDKPTSPESKNPSAKPLSDFLPLQEGMLSTIKNHDEFIKRVKEKNKV